MTGFHNGDLALGESGWIVLAHNATGVDWAVSDGQLSVDGRAAVSGPSGSLVVFSPRCVAEPGDWEAEVQVTCTPPALVDLSLVAGENVPVPGPAPQPAPYEVQHVGEQPLTLRAHRSLGPEARTVGLRVRAPSGCRLVVSRANVHATGSAPLSPTGVGIRGARGPFRDGVLVARGAALTVEVGVRGDGPAELTILSEDRYRGGSCELLRTTVVLTQEPQWLPITVPTDVEGAWAVVAELRGPATLDSAVMRFVVDEDAAALGTSDGPWALTIDTLSLDVESELLDLLGVGHVRTYSGFTPYDLPAALSVKDPVAAAAMVDAMHFIGVAAGTPAAMTARAVAGIEPGRPLAGWPAWRTASAMLADAPETDLAPVAALLDPLAGRTLVAEMGQLDDPVAFSRVIRAVVGGTRGRAITWLAGNEPDLWQQEGSAERGAEQSRVFAAAVRQADPDAQLVGPALADGWDGGHQGMLGWQWLERWARAGGADAVDAVSVHLHMLDEPTQSPEHEGLEARLAALQVQVAQWCGRPMPVWITEMGWRSLPDIVEASEPGESGPAVSEADQADLIVRAAVLAAAAGVERFYAFHLTGFRPTGEGHRFAWGLLSGHVGGPKPAFAALRRLVRSTAGMTTGPALATANRVRAVPFCSSDQDVHIVWQWSGGPGLWTLDDAPPTVVIRDLMGQVVSGTDLRRPHVVHSSATDRAVVARWLEQRLAPRYDEPMHHQRPVMVTAASREDLHVTTG